MADVELVIKIPSEVYENIKNATADDNDISSLLLGIHEGTPHDTHDKTCMNCFHNYCVRHNTEFNPEDIVCEYWESDGLTKDDFCSRWKDKESKE